MTAPDLIAELAACPYCGGEAMAKEETTAPKDCRHYVRCRPCGAETALQPTREIAADAWNRRTHHAEIEAMARDARLFRLMFPDEVGRELARKTLEAVKP